jgi:hypothetical protein
MSRQLQTMGEITSVAKNTKDFASLRTTIPMSMVRQWQLKPKDKLYWEWKVVDGAMVAVIDKFESDRVTSSTESKKGKTRDGKSSKK